MNITFLKTIWICLFWIWVQAIYAAPVNIGTGTLPDSAQVSVEKSNDKSKFKQKQQKSLKKALKNRARASARTIFRWIFWGFTILWNLALLFTNISIGAGLLHFISFLLFWIIGSKPIKWKNQKRFQWLMIFLTSFSFILRSLFYFPGFFSLIVSFIWLLVDLDKKKKNRLNPWFWTGIILLWLTGGFLIYTGVDLFVTIGLLPIFYYFFIGWIVFIVYLIGIILILLGLSLVILGIIFLVTRIGKIRRT